ncbi:hypothetical protein D3C77_557440 [compost metagenome]
MFVVAQFQVAGLQLLQPVDNPLLRLGRLHHRQGVDEQPQHFVGTGQAGWPARHGGAEAHRGLPGIALQQQQPGRLDQGVWGDAQALGLLAQLPGTRGIPTQVQRGVPLQVCRRASRQAVRQPGRAFQLLQLASPELLQRRLGLPGKPADVIAKPPCRCSCRVTMVGLQHLTEQS